MLIDWFTTIAQVINFLVLVWLLKRFLYKPILRAIDEREKLIAAKLSNAAKIKLDAKRESEEFKRKIKNIDDQRVALISKATQEAQGERARLLEEAKKEIGEFVEKSREDIKREENQVQKSIIQKTQQEVFALTRKVLMDLSGVTLESQMVEVFIQRLSEMDEDTKSHIKSVLSSSASQGIVRSTVELNSQQRKAIESAIGTHFNKKPELQFEIVPDLLGGIEFIMDGQKLAWSIDDYLDSMEKRVHDLLTSETWTP